MDDVATRAIAVVGVLGVVAVVVLTLRMVDRRGRRGRLAATGLTPGIYLFTSNTCTECSPAREALEARLGKGGYVEVAWETERGVFERLGIDEVPCSLVVDDSGSASVWPGPPERMFSVIDP